MNSYCVFETRFGWAAVAGTDGMLTRVVLPVESRDESARSVRAGLASDSVEDVAAFGSLPQRLRDYFDGEPVDLSNVPVDLDMQPPFVRKALLECKKVEHGTVVTYAEIARRAGSAKACRAVGNAMASNPAPVVVPCHRVIASSGGLGGFSGGLEWKRRLLGLEGISI